MAYSKSAQILGSMFAMLSAFLHLPAVTVMFGGRDAESLAVPRGSLRIGRSCSPHVRLAISFAVLCVSYLTLVLLQA